MTLFDLNLHLLGLKDKLRHKPSKDGILLFDPVRRKWLKSQSEELVRQLCLLYFMDRLNINRTSLVVEKQIKLDSNSRRIDILVLKQTEPYLLVECKSFEEKLSIDHFIQVSNYNREIQAPFILIINGHQSYLFDRNGQSLQSLEDIF